MVFVNFKIHLQNECNDYMAMTSISHTRKAISVFYHTHTVISWLCGQVKSLKKKSPEYKMSLGEAFRSPYIKDCYHFMGKLSFIYIFYSLARTINRVDLALTYTS